MKLLCILTLTACAALAAEKKVKLEDLPAAVQAAVKEQTKNGNNLLDSHDHARVSQVNYCPKNATLVGLSTEKEKGKGPTTVFCANTIDRNRGIELDSPVVRQTGNSVRCVPTPTFTVR